MSDELAPRAELAALLRGGQAHMTMAEAAADFPPEAMNAVLPGVTYTAWHLLDHIRLAQRDILTFVTDPHYAEPAWPDDYWPAPGRQAHASVWQATLDGYHTDLDDLARLLENPAMDLAARVAHGSGQTMLREFLLVADHTAYHIGEFAIMRQVTGTWPKGHV